MGWADKGGVMLDGLEKLDYGQVVKGLECHFRKPDLYPEGHWEQ